MQIRATQPLNVDLAVVLCFSMPPLFIAYAGNMSAAVGDVQNLLDEPSEAEA
jgi:hypothetical protein